MSVSEMQVDVAMVIAKRALDEIERIAWAIRAEAATSAELVEVISKLSHFELGNVLLLAAARLTEPQLPNSRKDES